MLDRDRTVTAIADALLALDHRLLQASPRLHPPVAVDRAREFLDAHFMRTVASDRTGSHHRPRSFCAGPPFPRRLGTSPYRYLVMRRLDRARSAITSGHSLAEAAFASGFADQSHMTRQFKQAFGLTPGHWHALQMRSKASSAERADLLAAARRGIKQARAWTASAGPADRRRRHAARNDRPRPDGRQHRAARDARRPRLRRL